MPTLTELNLYPIKSCAGISLSQARVMRYGLQYGQVRDREWMVVNHDGNFLTQREVPQMACIRPRLTGETLEIDAPGMSTLSVSLDLPEPDAPTMQVRVWDDSLTAYCGDDVSAEWFSQALGVPCRLARFRPQTQRIINNHWTSGRDVQTLFADGFPMLLISEGSLADLNQRLHAQSRAPLPMNRFRPNLVIDGVDAFEEDYADTLQIGSVRLQPVKPCPRCPMPSIDQTTGLIGPDPLDILQSYRVNPKVDGGITFGMNVILLDGENEMLQVGQEVEIELAF